MARGYGWGKGLLQERLRRAGCLQRYAWRWSCIRRPRGICTVHGAGHGTRRHRWLVRKGNGQPRLLARKRTAHSSHAPAAGKDTLPCASSQPTSAPTGLQHNPCDSLCLRPTALLSTCQRHPPRTRLHLITLHRPLSSRSACDNPQDHALTAMTHLDHVRYVEVAQPNVPHQPLLTHVLEWGAEGVGLRVLRAAWARNQRGDACYSRAPNDSAGIFGTGTRAQSAPQLAREAPKCISRAQDGTPSTRLSAPGGALVRHMSSPKGLCAI